MLLTKGILLFIGTVMDLIGLFLTLVVIDMFQHPRGMGAERLFGPLFGLAALGLFAAGAVTIYFAVVLRKRT